MIEWLEAHMAPCVFVKYFHIECPGCGTQRAFVALLKGEVWQSIKLYPALIPFLMTLLLLVSQLLFKFRSGAFYVMYAFIVSAAIMMISYVIKLIS
ncbi:MAG: DUF2752 domain-containing protein [Sphingobacteriaceae bacterium]